jgi:hypothetical protein
MITRDDIETLFKKMQKSGWNMHEDQVWGYFFKDPSQQKLKEFSQELNRLGYTIIDINQSYPDKNYWLHIEKTQPHSIDSLYQLNQFFYQLAKENSIQSYDGMDISPVSI